jgi:hypothetical protein
MKLVFTKAEVAAALGKSARRFDELRPQLEALGFPRPIPGLGASWSVLQVQQWVDGAAKFPAPASSLEAATADGSTACDVGPSVCSPNVVEIQQHLEARYGGRRA